MPIDHGSIWSTVVTVVLAVISSGSAVALINWLQNRRKNTAEAEDIWDKIKNRNIVRTDAQLEIAKEHLKLCEYKVDLLADGWSSMITRIERITGEDFSDARNKLREIQYLNAIPGRNPPASINLEDEDET